MECSIIITTEPLWAALVAVTLLGDGITATTCAGGALIFASLGLQEGLIQLPGSGGGSAEDKAGRP